MKRLLLILSVMVLVAPLIGCSLDPTHRHAELEWQLRHDMPEWGPDEWNAWEDELAAALGIPEADPPMFPEDEDED